MFLKDKRILLGVCGGIAAYKSLFLARKLTSLGAKVRVVMTKDAEEFVTKLSFQALTLEEVRTSMFDLQAERAMSHIELARWAELVIIAPATANFLAYMAHGIAHDLLSTIYLVTEVPVIVCPAMNHSMWAHKATEKNCQILQERGVFFVGPQDGEQACGEQGLGRMSEVEDIIDSLCLFDLKDLLKNKEFIVTAGSTREYIDPVRFISNCSSGKMGYSIVKALLAAGAKVTLISGISNCSIPLGANYIFAESAQEMLDSAKKSLKSGMIVIGVAAVGDYKVKHIAAQKLKNKGSCLQIDLVENPDILYELSLSNLASYMVGFAAETQNLLPYAKEKMAKKSLNMVVGNIVGDKQGFHVDENAVTIITKNHIIEVPKQQKLLVAKEIVKQIAREIG